MQLWWWVALAGAVLLPWHMQQDGLRAGSLLALFQDDPEAASAAAQAVRHGRFWFWPVLAALAIGAPAALLPGLGRERRGGILVAAGTIGILAVVAQGFAIGIRGWTAPWLEALFGPIEDRQFGIGIGGAVALVGFLFQVTDGLARQGAFKGDRFTAGAVGLLAGSILVFTFWPMATILSQAFGPTAEHGPLLAFAERVADRKVWGWPASPPPGPVASPGTRWCWRCRRRPSPPHSGWPSR